MTYHPRLVLVLVPFAAAGALALVAGNPPQHHPRPLFRSSFEHRGVHEWSVQDGGSAVSVVRGRRNGEPKPRSGRRVARFVTTVSAVQHAKLYEGFGTHVGASDSKPPADVSGTYRSWFFFPRSFRVPRGTWVNIFQFKEKYHDAGGDRSDPLWWVQLGDARWARKMGGPPVRRTTAPVAFLNHWGGFWTPPPHFVRVPLGKWIKIRADVVQGRYIDFWLASRYLGRARDSRYHVSPFHGANSMEWTFGVGEYSTGANGPLFIDDAAVYPPG